MLVHGVLLGWVLPMMMRLRPASESQAGGFTVPIELVPGDNPAEAPAETLAEPLAGIANSPDGSLKPQTASAPSLLATQPSADLLKPSKQAPSLFTQPEPPPVQPEDPEDASRSPAPNPFRPAPPTQLPEPDPLATPAPSPVNPPPDNPSANAPDDPTDNGPDSAAAGTAAPTDAPTELPTLAGQPIEEAIPSGDRFDSASSVFMSLIGHGYVPDQFATDVHPEPPQPSAANPPGSPTASIILDPQQENCGDIDASQPGTFTFRVDISATGELIGAVPWDETGAAPSPTEDALACLLPTANLRFEPARGADGQPVYDGNLLIDVQVTPTAPG